MQLMGHLLTFRLKLGCRLFPEPMSELLHANCTFRCGRRKGVVKLVKARSSFLAYGTYE